MRSKYFLYLISLLLLSLLLFFSFINTKHARIQINNGDSWGYYSYLPAAFIHHDLGDYSKTVESTRIYTPDFQDPLKDNYGLYHQHPITKKNIVKYNMGVAIMLAPAFAVVHYKETILKHETGGFSSAYNIGMAFGVIFWVVLGAFFLFLVLKKYFSIFHSIIVVLILVLGTNVFYNTVFVPVMSHALLFSLYSIFIYLVDSFYNIISKTKIVLIGILIGLICLIRLTEIFPIVILIFWGCSSKKEFAERIIFIKRNFSSFVWMALFSFFIILPQLIYWYINTGEFLFYSYVGEKFDFLHPHILDGLFSFNNGWLIWSPLMLLSIIGIFFSYKQVKVALSSTIIIIPIYLYVIYSWWCWTYINGFGSRPMEHLYPLLSFALANFFVFVSKRKYIFNVIILPICALGTTLNIFQVAQTNLGVLRTEGANKAHYFSTFLKRSANFNQMIARASNEIQPNKPNFLKCIRNYDTAMKTSLFYTSKNDMYNRERSWFMSDTKVVIDTIAADELKGAKYLKVSGSVFFTLEGKKGNAIWDLPYLHFHLKDNNFNNIFSDRGIYPFQFCGNPSETFYSTGEGMNWGDFYLYIKIRKPVSHYILELWNPKQCEFYVRNFKIELFE